MKKIYLTRHAKAKKDEVGNDFERTLSKKGLEELEKLIPRLKKHAIKPDIIIASPAFRTAKTATMIAKALDYDTSKIAFEEFLYEANAKEIFTFLKGLSDEFSEVLLIAHNPALKELCELLCEIHLSSFPTSSTLEVEFNIDKFENLCERGGKILFFEKIKE